MKDTELWKPFPLDTRYEVSTYGRIRNVSTQKIRICPIKQNGYPGLVFTYPGHKRKGYDVHAMVAITWLGPRPIGFDVSHQDGNKLNNNVSNLAYESRRMNANKPFNKYSKGFHRILTAKDVYDIRSTPSISNNEWAKKLNVGRAAIWKVRVGMTWRHLI